jgi:MscS family membrane protein
METLTDFAAEFSDVWQTAIFGVGVGPVLGGMLVFLVFVLARGLFSRVIISFLSRLSRRTRTTFDDELVEALQLPLRFVFIVAGLYVAERILPLPPEVDVFMVKVIRSLIAFTIFWTLYRCAQPLSFLVNIAFGALGQRQLGESLKDFFTKLAKFVIACVGIVAVLEEWDFNVGAVLGGLGLIGMAVAFGAQNLIANLFAGVSIFLDNICVKGDWIRAGDVEGTVEEIGFRTTKVRRFDKALTTLPNSRLATDAVVNFSRMTNRRIYWKIGLEYRTTEDQLRRAVNGIRDYVMNSDAFETDPARVATLIHVDSFNDSSIDIMLYCFTRTTVWAEWMQVKEDLAYHVKEIVEGAGAGFAFPSTSLYVESLPFGEPEIFTGAKVASEAAE